MTSRPPANRSWGCMCLVLLGVVWALAGLSSAFAELVDQAVPAPTLPPRVTTIPGKADPQIAHAPTIGVATIEWELRARQSPLAGLGPLILRESQQDGIDAAFALADWAAESGDGTSPIARQTHNVGNITGTPGLTVFNPTAHTFKYYATWQDGIDAWFGLLRWYVAHGHASDLLTFALYYVNGHTPNQATASEKQDLEQGYLATIRAIVATLQAHEAQG